MASRTYWVYLLASHGDTLYCGVTNKLNRRTIEHKFGQGTAFSSRYEVHKLVWFESFTDVKGAIAREKQIKGGNRAKKLALIDEFNPEWDDLFDQILE